jgi:SAM-dependent methyltransferase
MLRGDLPTLLAGPWLPEGISGFPSAQHVTSASTALANSEGKPGEAPDTQEPDNAGDRDLREKSLGRAAELYDKVRPAYPPELFKHIARHLPGPAVLEVGARTGKATAGLIGMGLQVTCVERSPGMAILLAQRHAAAPPAQIIVSTFESLAELPPFDGLISATAWHWTNPDTNLDRAAALLKPGGYLALIWNTSMFTDPSDYHALQTCYDQSGITATQRPTEPLGTLPQATELMDPHTWPGSELDAHPDFTYLGASIFPWEQQFSVSQFVEFLASTSACLILSPETRNKLLANISARLTAESGSHIPITWHTQCYGARRNLS